MITVAIPVGPYPANKRWLKEALDSVYDQTHKPDEILLIDDMAAIPEEEVFLTIWPDWHKGIRHSNDIACKIWRSPWRLGVAHAFNFGVALAKNELVFMLGSDDYLEPQCLERCIKEWEKNNKTDGYYYVGVKYLDDRSDKLQTTPCNAAMVTKGTWRKTGGFAVESAVGTPDANFLSQMAINHIVPVIGVAGGHPLYNYRPHDQSDTASKGPWQGVILATRDILTATWKKPEWGRYE